MDEDFSGWSGMDYVHPRLVPADPELAALLPEALAREHNVLPLGKVGRALTILIGDPNDFSTMDLLRFVLRPCSEVRFALTSPSAIREGIQRMYGTADRSA
jgi:type IV pilus assembly protein PilB